MKKIIVSLHILVLLVILTACEKELECLDGQFIDNNECITEIDFESEFPKQGVYYELFVRSFADSDGDGVGDFNGITENLDYFTELGIDTLWLMPIHPSPTYHGYDVLDYYDVNSEYGTMADFENLLEKSEEVGINIILDLVVNHTSSQHVWFQEWQSGNPDYAGYYRKITSNDSRYQSDSSHWHALDSSNYYYGYFGGGMPDLNWSNQKVKDQMLDVALFWLEKGVDGYRMDAVLHVENDGEVKPPSIGIDSTLFTLEWYEYMIKEQYPDAYLVGEVWSDLSTFSKFYQSMDSTVNFDTGARIVSAVNRGFSSDYMRDTLRNYEVIKEVDSEAIDAPFLYNHDQDRIATILSNDTYKLKLAAEMLLSLEGNPYIYYGEELGMFGYKTLGPTIWDETRRLPLIWDNEYDTTWITDPINDDVQSVSEQFEDPNSLLNVYKAMINLRQSSLALQYGVLEEYDNSSSVLQAYYRTFDYNEYYSERVLVLHNLAFEEYQLNQIEGEILYYSNGIDNFSGSMDRQTTLIIKVPYEGEADE